MHILSSTRSGVGLLKIGFLACPTRMGGPIQDLEWRVPCTYPILDSKILSKFEVKKEYPKICT